MTENELNTIRDEYEDDETAMALVIYIDNLKHQLYQMRKRCKVLSKGLLCPLCGYKDECLGDYKAGI